jgi:hypothetical protein
MRRCQSAVSGIWGRAAILRRPALTYPGRAVERALSPDEERLDSTPAEDRCD